MKDVPILRFTEFEGVWEIKELGDLCEIKTGNKDTQNKIEGGIYPFFVRSNTVERINSYSFDGEAILTSGDGVGVGKNFHYINGKFDFHQRVYCLRKFKHKISTRFIYYVFSEQFYNRAIKLSAKNSVDSVRMDMIANMKILVPSLYEQEKVAGFLSAVDEKLQQLKQKKTLLAQYKKGVMQQIFNQEIRFKDDDGNEFPEWEEKSLGEVAELTSSKRIYLSDYVNEGIPFYRGKEISELKFNTVPTDILYISEKAYLEFKERYGVPKINDILMTAVGTLGNVLRIKNNDPFYFKDGNLIWFKDIKESSSFLEILFEINKEEINKISIGSTQRALTMVELRKLVFKFPLIPEQTKIANFLSAIDENINNITNQLTLTEQWKKGLLQKMFV